MKRKRFTVEQIIRMLREAEVLLSQGKSVKLLSRELGITEQTYYRLNVVVIVFEIRLERLLAKCNSTLTRGNCHCRE